MTVHAGGDDVPVKPSRGLQRWLPRISVIIRAFNSRELSVHQFVEVGKLHIDESPKRKPEKGNPRKHKQAQKGITRSNFSVSTRLLKWWQLLNSRTKKKKKVKKTKFDILARAFYRMQLLTNSQMEMLLETCGLVKEEDNKEMENMVERVMAWRDKRGDFEDVDGYEEEAEVQQDPVILPFYMEDISKNFLHYCGLLKTDLQLECLLRNIQYSRDDTKPDLISKLMEFKHNLFSESRGLELENDA